MDPNQINHAQAWAWELHQQQMAGKASENGSGKPPFQYPTEPSDPMPDNPIFFNVPDQGMNLNNLPLYNNLPQYRQLTPGDVQMGTELRPPMQTPMDVNTGIFMQNPLPVEQLMQKPMGVGMDLDDPVAGAQDLLEIPDHLAVPPLEDPKFDPSGSNLPQSTTHNLSPQQGLLGQLPSIPTPERSLFMQPMIPPRGMPQNVFMMLQQKQQQQQQQQQQIQNWQMGGFNPPSGLHMQPMQQPLTQGHQMGIPMMNMPPMQMSPMQMPHTNMPQMPTPRAPQMQSGMRMSPSPVGTPPNPTRQVRFQEVSDVNPPNNVFSPSPGGPNNNMATLRRLPNGTLAPQRKIIRKHVTGNPTPVPPNASQVPKAVVQISQEPFSRTFPPNVSHENLKKGDEPPSNGQYLGGKMTVKDHQEHRSNMVYLGKPIGQPKDRIPAPLRQLGPVPQFYGDPDDFNAVKEHLNTLTDWTNQYVRTALNTVARYNTHTENLTKQLKGLELEKKHITDAVQQVHKDQNMSIPDFIRNTKISINKLEEAVDFLNYHHKGCMKAPKALETLKSVAVRDKTEFELQKEMVDRRMVELETVKNAVRERDETLQTKDDDLRQAKDLIVTYQVQIQELVNKENFNDVAKVQVLQQLTDTREAATKLEQRYLELFEKAKGMSREIQALKTITGWIAETPDQSEEEHEDPTENNLSSRYQVLLENSKFIVNENAKLKEQVKARTSIFELQAEYDKLKAEKAEFEKALGGIKNIQEHISKTAAIEKALMKAKTTWNAEKARLQRDLDQCRGVISHLKTQQGGSTKQQKDYEEAIKGLQAKNMEAEQDRQRVQEDFDKLKYEYEKFLEEKKQIEEKTTKLMEIHKLVLVENANLKERRLARQIEIEALKKRLKEGGPEKIIRVEAPGSKKGHECLLTRGELMEVLSQDDFREYMHSYLKAVGHVKG
ncbi:hypothetical protein TWF106_010235 [Orbilia oligospora]|uniref:Uncharacterized protein n=1 Tax=Orbilia oligospora TaxID=2813651 RepID=A0A6G1M2J5_ORBOL|nr:hypothetical protein TWF788_002800 [Orbilia oligospora]KAF3211349.1 hypothetical protein TWF106_010235 [Orbilia oligospora]KAF3214269.1 hypothetical protein TWF191_009785 [Orbilia oligospora]KAF3241413.1 hypothetical protein TWF192_009153 [Orbilia oligospora]